MFLKLYNKHFSHVLKAPNIVFIPTYMTYLKKKQWKLKKSMHLSKNCLNKLTFDTVIRFTFGQLEQLFNALHVPVRASLAQRGPPEVVHAVDVYAAGSQQARHLLRLVVHARLVQVGFAFHVHFVYRQAAPLASLLPHLRRLLSFQIQCWTACNVKKYELVNNNNKGCIKLYHQCYNHYHKLLFYLLVFRQKS